MRASLTVPRGVRSLNLRGQRPELGQSRLYNAGRQRRARKFSDYYLLSCIISRRVSAALWVGECGLCEVMRVPIPLFMKRMTSIPWTLDDIRFRICAIIIETRVRLRARVLGMEVGR